MDYEFSEVQQRNMTYKASITNKTSNVLMLNRET